MDKNKLLTRLQTLDLILKEAALYLDAYPNNREALEYFNKNNKMREEVHKEYTEKYGPIMQGDSKSSTTWDWVKDPWPWESMEEE